MPARARLKKILLAIGLLSALAPPLLLAQNQKRCREIVDTSCDTCHYKTRICQVLGSRGRWGWKRTIKRMVRYGARISEQDRETLLDCLVKASAGEPFACSYTTPEK